MPGHHQATFSSFSHLLSSFSSLNAGVTWYILAVGISFVTRDTECLAKDFVAFLFLLWGNV